MDLSASDSETEVEEIEDFLQESAVFRKIGGKVLDDWNSWPCFVARDVEVFSNASDGELANPLEVAIRGPMTMRFRLDVEAEDEDLIKQLKGPHLKNAHVVLNRVEGFSFGTSDDSVGLSPVVIWIATKESGWIEILPSIRFTPIYNAMTTAIQIFYYIQTLYEDEASWSWPIQQVLLKYAVLEGSGLSRAQTEGRMRKHAPFLLAQLVKIENEMDKTEMESSSTAQLANTVFYKWLMSKCPDLVALLKKNNKNKLKSLNSTQNVVSEAINVVELQAAAQEEADREKAAAEKSSSVSEMAGKSKRSPQPGKSRFAHVAIDTSNMTQIPQNNAEWVVYIIEDLVASGECTIETATIRKVWGKMFKSFSVSDPGHGREVVKLNAWAARCALDPKTWKHTELYKQLAVYKGYANRPSEEKPGARTASSTEIKPRRAQEEIEREAAIRRGDSSPQPYSRRKRALSPTALPIGSLAESASQRSSRVTRRNNPPLVTGKAAVKAAYDSFIKSKTSRATPEPQSEKTVPTPLAGGPSGKRAQYRPANTPSVNKRPTSSDSDNEPSTYSRSKRSRTGDAAQELRNLNLTDSGSEAESSDSNLPFNFGANQIRGPHSNSRDGSWLCDLHEQLASIPPGCQFVIWNPGSASAEASFQEHMKWHKQHDFTEEERRAGEDLAEADIEAGVARAKAESAATNNKVDHLLEYLIAQGKESKAQEALERQVIKGKPIPMMIKRRRE